jgi:pyruvate/2-oxoglutarate dehydrogenase complex dihydrolipoamide acyltransferase (E2) component
MAAKALTFSEFAQLRQCSNSYVTKLKDQGRLVLTADGKKIKVKETLALIEQTAGTRDDVSTRHQNARKEAQPATPAKKIADSEPSTPAEQKKPARSAAKDTELQSALKEAQRAKAMAESRRVVALADKEEMERDRLAGDLISREDVDVAMKFIGATVYALMDVFPSQNAPLVAPTMSLHECESILQEGCREVLVRLGAAIERQKAALEKDVG